MAHHRITSSESGAHPLGTSCQPFLSSDVRCWQKISRQEIVPFSNFGTHPLRIMQHTNGRLRTMVRVKTKILPSAVSRGALHACLHLCDLVSQCEGQDYSGDTRSDFMWKYCSEQINHLHCWRVVCRRYLRTHVPLHTYNSGINVRHKRLGFSAGPLVL